MILERYRQLLTAYVDGELSSRQRRHVARLLRRSPEARQLLQKLQADARLLRQLPRPSLPMDLTGSVLRTIAERRLTAGQRRTARASSASSWVAPLACWAAAASVLLILGTVSYLYFATAINHPAPPELTQNTPRPETPVSKRPESEAGSARPKDLGHPDTSPSQPSEDFRVAQASDNNKPAHSTSPPASSEKSPVRSKEETALTDRLEQFQLDRVTDLLPIIVKVSDLEEESQRKTFVAELRKDSSFRLELPCPNGTKALDRLQRAAKSQRIGLVIDKQAQERINLKWRTNYLVYLENITPEELTQLVRQIGIEDRRIAANKPAELQLDRLFVSRLTGSHRKELSALMGVDPTMADSSPAGPLGTELHTPLPDQTAHQLGQALAGQGGTPRAETAKTSAKPPQKIALVLAYFPVRPSPGSEEIKHFLNSRTPARAGTLRVVLLFRS